MPEREPTILIVDDSAMTRRMIKRVIGLTDLPIGEMMEAGDGKEALDLLEKMRVDLVLADLNMPVMDGVEMIAAMRKSDRLRSIPVVVISAQPDPHVIEQLERDGVLGYLPKPFTPEGVRDLIAPILNSVVAEAAVMPVAPAGPVENNSFNLTLAEALAEALETMAFISPQWPEKPGFPAPSPELRIARVAFHGEGFRGSLALVAPKSFGAVIAGNCEGTDGSADADDALRELTNVTCGLLLRKRIGGGAGFEMTPPVMSDASDSDKWIRGDDVVIVEADGYLIAAHVNPDAFVAETVEAS